MRIPGLGCLKGCLFTLVMLFVAGWLVWELTPLQDWIGTGKSYWQLISGWVGRGHRLDQRSGGLGRRRLRATDRRTSHSAPDARVCGLVDIWRVISVSAVKVGSSGRVL